TMIYANKNNDTAITGLEVYASEPSSIATFQAIKEETAAQLIERALDVFGDKIALASSFSLEDNVILDIMIKINKRSRIFALDTGRLNEETFEAAEKIRRRYGCEIEWFFPKESAVQKLEREKGLYSFRESIDNRKECCAIRKVEPLKRALSGLDAWITGQRREQSLTRATLSHVEADNAHGGIIKLNPLADWSMQQVREYATENLVPYNRLYDYGYTSIGCAPCTRAVEDGEEERAGRWWWEAPEHKECGLHLVQPRPEQRQRD
ncbi:MAG TPA: phosphoadenylyl-sulfate reductase, partial [Chroococcales cyanobacterium]